MTNVVISIPAELETYYSLNDWQNLLRLNTAIDLYRQGKISTKMATTFAGLSDEIGFLQECHERGVPRQTYDSIEELKAEVENLSHLLAIH